MWYNLGKYHRYQEGGVMRQEKANDKLLDAILDFQKAEKSQCLAIVKDAVDNDKADVNAIKKAYSALEWAAFHGLSEVASFLIEKGADVKKGEPLFLTVRNIGNSAEREEIVRMLIDNGVDVTKKDADGRTAEDYAKNRHPEIAKLLAKEAKKVEDEAKKADEAPKKDAAKSNTDTAPTQPQSGGKVGISDLEKACRARDLAKIRKVATSELINSKTSNGFTVLMIAAFKGYNDVTELLIQKGAEIDMKDDSHGRTALMLAALGGHADIVRTLIKAGADVNMRRGDEIGGPTVLMLVAKKGNEEVVDILLKEGANKNATVNEDGTFMTAADIAAKSGHMDLAAKLGYSKARNAVQNTGVDTRKDDHTASTALGKGLGKENKEQPKISFMQQVLDFLKGLWGKFISLFTGAGKGGDGGKAV